jgi:hypothetical protein
VPIVIGDGDGNPKSYLRIMRWQNLYILIFGLLQHGVIEGQSGFNKTLDNGESLRFISTDLAEDILFVSGFSKGSGEFQTGFVAALDTFGEVAWWTEISDDSSHITMNDEIGMLIDGIIVIQPFVFSNRSSFGVVAVETTGSIRFIREYVRPAGSVTSPRDIVAIDNGYLITGWTSLPPDFVVQAFVLKIDKNGTRDWFKMYGNTQYEQTSRTITSLGENEFVHSGIKYHNDPNSGFSHGWALAIDSLGNKQWEWEASEEEIPYRGIMSMQYDSVVNEWVYVSFVEKLVFVKDLGREVDLSTPVLVRRDSAMQLLSFEEYGPYSYNGYMGALIPSRMGGWIAAGNTTCLTEESPYNNCNIESGRVIKLKNDGELDWSVVDTAFFHPELGSRSYLSGITESPSGSVYAVGWANNEDEDGVYRSFGWLLKITADGCVDTLCTTTSLLEQLQVKQEHVLVYPNPATDHLVFELTTGADVLQAALFDFQGRRLSTMMLRQGANVVPLDQTILPGLYLWSVFNEQGQVIDSGKIMIAQDRE